MPTYKVMSTKCVTDFCIFCSRLYQFGFQPSFFFLDQTNVVIARNSLVKHYLEAAEKTDEPYSAVLWIDSDQTYTFKHFLDLLANFDRKDMDILSGRYITRDMFKPKVCGFIEVRGDYNNPLFKNTSVDDTGIVEVDGIGFGFVMMKPIVLEDMYDIYGLHQFEFRSVGTKESGGNIGEDLDWCLKAQLLGYKIYMDNDVEVGHHGGIIDSSYIYAKRHISNETRSYKSNKSN